MGQQELAQGAPTDALALFDAALALQPDNAIAAQHRDWAMVLQEGEAALDAANWPVAVAKLEAAYTSAPDYLASAGDGVDQKLYAARLGWGQALLEEGEYAEAEKRCRQAAELVSTSAEAAACLNVASTAVAARASESQRTAARPAPAPAPPVAIQPQLPPQPARPAPPSPPQPARPAPAPPPPPPPPLAQRPPQQTQAQPVPQPPRAPAPQPAAPQRSAPEPSFKPIY